MRGETRSTGGAWRRVMGRRRSGSLAPTLVTLALLLGAAPGPLLAATAGKIGMLDMRRIERQSVPGAQVAEELRAERLKDELEAKKLEDEVEALRGSMGSLAAEQLAQKEAELKAKVQALEESKATRPKEREAKRNRMSREFRKKVQAVVREYAKEQGLAAVFLRGRGLFYGDEAIDITGAILERLNRPAAVKPAPEPAKQ